MKIIIRILNFVIILLVFVNCNNKRSRVFKKPQLFNSQNLDSLDRLSSIVNQVGNQSIYIGIYRFGDEVIDINPDSSNVLYRKRFPNDIIRSIYNSDSLKANGSPLLIADYKNDILVFSDGFKKMFPVYLVNHSSKNMEISSNSTFLSYLDQKMYFEHSNTWHTFEPYDSSSFQSNFSVICGCCDFNYIIQPNEFMVYLLPKESYGSVMKMKISHRDGFESDEFYGLIDTAEMVKYITYSGEIGLIDSSLYNLLYRKYQGDPM